MLVLAVWEGETAVRAESGCGREGLAFSLKHGMPVTILAIFIVSMLTVRTREGGRTVSSVREGGWAGLHRCPKT